MPTATYAGTAVAVNDEGFFTDPAQWRDGWPRRSPRPRASPSSPGGTGRSSSSCGTNTRSRAPGRLRVLGKTSGVSVRELYQLFPKGPAKIAAKIAGIPKPRGCI